ncbi:MAG TPA: hypothetical protein DD653_00020 [Marinilabiliales bacterium]|nr:hypothetical protein [Marinilabiliales bacterium]HBO73064.1 hypothetical protein [Marinilabiliales bacterium]
MTNSSILKISRVTGVLFLLSLIVPILNWFFMLSNFFSVQGNTSLEILSNELLFRLSIMNEIISAIIIFTLAFFLHLSLKTINSNLSLFAFSLKTAEAFLTLVLALGHFIILLVIKEDANKIQFIVDVLIGKHIFLTIIPGIFFGLSMVIFSYIFLKSKYIPRVLAVFGIVSYSLVIIYDSTQMLSPYQASLLIVQLTGSLPVCIFQVVVGLWLACKGITIKSK